MSAGGFSPRAAACSASVSSVAATTRWRSVVARSITAAGASGRAPA
jgi:hypothetical protein